jgi:hypothetical protein
MTALRQPRARIAISAIRPSTPPLFSRESHARASHRGLIARIVPEGSLLGRSDIGHVLFAIFKSLKEPLAGQVLISRVQLEALTDPA